MLILALDTSGDLCSVAISRNNIVLADYTFRHERHLSERLPTILGFLLKDSGTTLREIDAFAVGLGPGSFTGVRVGVTMAKTWAYALKKPVVGISSLDALAHPFVDLPVVVAAVAPTRRTECIAAFYNRNSNLPVAAPEVIAHTDIADRARLLLPTDLPLIIIGEIAETIREALFDEHILIVTSAPSASTIARLAYRRLQNGDSDAVHALEPLYIAPTPVG